jgi:hypothetical protein
MAEAAAGTSRWIRRILLSLLAFVVVSVAVFIIWSLNPPRPMPKAIEAMQGILEVDVRSEPWLIFQPTASERSTGLILYPGGRVDPRAYAPAARAIAQQGYLVVIVPMPLNLAVFGAQRAERVIQAFPEITAWVVGGHSLGGAMAAHYASLSPNQVKGLVLWASYPAVSDNLRDSGLYVVSIYGTRDGLTTLEDIQASTILLPDGTIWVEIEGGNHAQFGYYGPQSGDLEAEITYLEQESMVVEATVATLSMLED